MEDGALRLMIGSLDRLPKAVHLRSGNDHNRRISHRLRSRSCILCIPFPVLILSKPNPRFRQIESKEPVFGKPQLCRKAIAFLRSFAEFLAPCHNLVLPPERCAMLVTRAKQFGSTLNVLYWI